MRAWPESQRLSAQQAAEPRELGGAPAPETEASLAVLSEIHSSRVKPVRPTESGTNPALMQIC